MSRSLKLPVAVHVLVALAAFRDRYVSSEILGKSVGTNPVVVRRILQALKRAGLVRSQGGVYGGASLAKAPEDITLRDVYEAVEEAETCLMHNGSSACSIAKTIARVVPSILEQVERARREQLQQFTIAGILADAEQMVADCDKEDQTLPA